jgi:hypothetical protein
MASCAIEGCADPQCQVCNVLARFPPPPPRILEPNELKQGAMALVGTKGRATRDPRLIKRHRKPLQGEG